MKRLRDLDIVTVHWARGWPGAGVAMTSRAPASLGKNVWLPKSA
jgi:hypothetical protein